jgi:transcription elongation factor GreB
MSRAFVSESDWSEEPDLPALKSPLPAGARNYMTARGLDKLKADIEQLASTDRPRLATAVLNARGSGDESGTALLKAAQHDLAVLDRRLEYLGELMRTAEVVHPPRGVADRVTFGATVRVYDKMERTEESYRIVGVYESDPEQGVVSWISPIATALKGKAIGEIVEIVLPDGIRLLKIVGIKNN